MFVNISFNLPMDSVWTYSVPDNLQAQIKIGSKVFASFITKKLKLGVVVSIQYDVPTFNTKPILSIVDDGIVLPEYIYTIRDKIAHYYACSINEALHLFVFESHPKIKDSQKIKVKKKQSIIPISELNTEQQYILDNIWELSEQGTQFTPSLIHGVTGSGKTEVYQALMNKVLQNQKQALLLLPEIGITTQMHQRFCRIFKEEDIAFIHSQMTPKEKQLTLKAISSGDKKIIIGPRSALFSPFKNLGIICMDEEHDFSYKSHQAPRYHTRRIAYLIAQYIKCPFVMGSATPSIETYFAAKNNKITLYTLQNRFYNVPLPTVSVIDTQQESNFFSDLLMKQISLTKKNKKQTILFMNRRGFSPLFMCKSCNYMFQCPDCSINLTYHKKKHKLICHYCGSQYPIPNSCPDCNKKEIVAKGVGTQRIEEEIQELFHSYKILRMDKDTTRKKNSYNQIISSFKDGDGDILVGTQMVTKGLDFPLVELVGILSCDMILNLPDFRGAEHVFTLITQVAGRSGRKTQGKVILQTRFIDHYAIKAAINQDYQEFYSQEIQLRKHYNYPPYSKFIRLLVRSPIAEKSIEIIEILYKQLTQEFPQTEIIGPTVCVLEKLNKQYRYHIILKIKDPTQYTIVIKKLLKEHNHKGNYHIECDVDPITLL